jgi:acetyl esterase/lipase
LTLAAVLAPLTAPGAAHAGLAAEAVPPELYPVKAARNITYYDVARDPHRDRHRLDVYSPRGRTGCPVLFFVHGGAWTVMSKDDVFGVLGYGTIARCLARRGLVVVLPNYRLSPHVRHPEHIKDVARAFAWTCRNAARYGGDPKRIFVGGHSAGGHLVSLLATDPAYLEAEGRRPEDIRGVIAISGVYNLTDFDLDLSVASPRKCVRVSGRISPLAPVFGTDPRVIERASPIAHVRPGLPPFLLVSAGLDYGPLRRMTADFADALEDNGCDVQVKHIPWRTHETMVFDIPHLTAEPQMVEAVTGFINRHGR